MKVPVCTPRSMTFASLALVIACALATPNLTGQSAPGAAVSLEPPTGQELRAHTFDAQGNKLPEAPANFRRLGQATIGEKSDLHTLTLRFSQTQKLTGLKTSSDFQIEPGGSCADGNVYEAKTTCTVLVRFTPQGAGNRLGHLSVTSSLSPTPMAFGIGGYGYSPVISFIPAQISTVPGTYPASKGLLTSAQNLTVDGGDTLWVADSGNGLIRQKDSSGNFITLATGYTGLSGVAVDSFGQAYFDVPSTGNMYEIYDYGPVVQISGAGTINCPALTPCTLNSEALSSPGELSIDGYNHLFFTDSHAGAAFSTVQPIPANLIFLYDPFPYQQNPSAAMAVDAGDNLYSLWANGGLCEIVQSTLYNAENNNVAFTKIAGGHTCGFAGDGGLGGNAEIGAKIGQIAFDIAGNLYFTDTNNQRVRRIDYSTGVINTIAGTGVAGYSGDGGAATLSAIANPTGVGVDSQGQVYIISGAATTGTAQVIRKVGPNGALPFSSQLKGTASAARTITISNTGNSQRVLTSYAFTGSNPGDFSIDSTTTSCLLTPGSILGSGQSCKVGVIFKPAAGGTRTANLVFNDNTVTNSNTVSLFGPATLPPAVLTITSPLSAASFKSGVAVPFTVTVTSPSGAAPTGTVAFSVDGVAKGTVTLAAGTATLSLTGLTIASHTLSATYSGDANYSTVSATRTITVTAVAKLPATVKLSAAISQDSACKAPTFKVAVAGNASASHTPTGTVQLKEGAKVLATATLSNGSANLLAPTLGPGTHTLTATYSGDSLHAAASSSAIKQIIPNLGPCLNPIATPIHVIHRLVN